MIGGGFKEGDIVWVKTSHGECTAIFTTRCVTEVVNLQLLLINGIPYYVKDWQLLSTSYPLSSDKSDTEESEQLIYLESGPPTDGSDISSLSVDTDMPSETPDDSPSEDETCVIPLWRKAHQKRSILECTICDEEIRGECGGDIPCRSKRRQIVYTSACRHHKPAKGEFRQIDVERTQYMHYQPEQG